MVVTTDDDFAGDVDQDCRGRAAILRAVIDAGEHDHGGCRMEAERERQQHRDGGDRTDARQHADQRAQEHADEAVGEILQGDGDAEAEREVGQDIHAASPQRFGHRLNGRPSSTTKMATEKAVSRRARPTDSTRRNSGSANPLDEDENHRRQHESQRLQQQREDDDGGEHGEQRPQTAAGAAARRHGSRLGSTARGRALREFRPGRSERTPGPCGPAFRSDSCGPAR